MSTAIKVLIADDLPSMQRRLTQILKKDSEISDVFTATNGYEAISKAIINKPDVVLMDINMETPTAGIDTTKAILTDLPNIKVIMLTVYEDDDLIFNAFQAGITDYVLKDATAPTILTAIKAAYKDESPIRPWIAKKLRNEFKRVRSQEQTWVSYMNIISTFTSAEIEVLKLLCQGKSRKEICLVRHVEESTIKTQIRSILRKFNVKDSKELINTVTSLNILSLIDKIHN